MTTTELKAVISTERKVSVGSLQMVRQFEDEAQTIPSPWLSHWDNTNRIRITMHEEVAKKISENPTRADLALKTAVLVTPEGKEPYYRYVVITPLHVELTF